MVVFELLCDLLMAIEEVFGLVLLIWCVKDFGEVIELVNALLFGLGSSVWMRDVLRVC